MIEHRYDAHALIMPGEHERTVGGRVGLLRLVLSDDGPLTDARTGHEHTQVRTARAIASNRHREDGSRLARASVRVVAVVTVLAVLARVVAQAVAAARQPVDSSRWR